MSWGAPVRLVHLSFCISVANRFVPSAGGPGLAERPAAFVIVMLNLLAAAPPVIIVLRFTPTAASLQMAIASEVPTGSGRTVIVKVLAGPAQEFFVPETEIVATTGELVTFDAAANVAIFPVPDATRPIAVLSFAQSNVTPPAPILDPNAGTTTV